LSLIGWWTFSEPDGDIVKDWSGKGNNAVIRGGTRFTVNPNKPYSSCWKAIILDGEDDYLAIQKLFFNVANQLKEFTVIAVVRVPTIGGDWSILDFDRSEYFTCATGIPPDVAWGEGDYVGFHTNALGYGIHDMWSSKTIRDGLWHVVAWRYNCYEKYDKKIWIDGELDSKADAYPEGVGVGTGTTRYGFIGDGSEADTFDGARNARYYEGDIGEIRFWDKSLPESHICCMSKALLKLYGGGSHNCICKRYGFR